MPDVMKLENRPVPIKYRGTFDLNLIYQTWVKWMKSQRMKYHEILYKDKNLIGDMRETEITALGTVKIDEFHKWTVNIFIQVFDGQPVEIIKDGKKKKMTRGRLYLDIQATIIRDYQGVYDSTPMLQKARGLILKVTKWEENIPIWDTYYYKTIKLHGMIRQLLGMDTSANAWQEVVDG
jgi:hypothetical protein